MAFEWTELTFLEKQSRNTGALVFRNVRSDRVPHSRGGFTKAGHSLAVILAVPVCVALFARRVDHGPQFHAANRSFRGTPILLTPGFLKLGGRR